ncbi:MAG: hypothetical protein ABFD83_13245 [Armatimonadota bacterium]
MDYRRELSKVHEYYKRKPIPSCLFQMLVDELELPSLNVSYLDLPLKNPLIVAPGQMTLRTSQVESIHEAGFAGCVLKSVVGESRNGCCSMINQRKHASYIRTFHKGDDPEGKRPIIHWDGRCDTRTLSEYMDFARKAHLYNNPDDFIVIASILCHLPFPHEDFLEEEWVHTTKVHYEAGFKHIEIDFCPFLASDDYTENQENVLRWYRTCPGIMKSVASDVKVFPKMLNLDWGLEFQLKMAEAAFDGGSDGVVVANRHYNRQYASGHGGEELRLRNLEQVRHIKERFPTLSISATGGVYSGRDIYNYLKAGAQNVQFLSYLMGKVNTPFARTEGSRFDMVFHKLILDPDDGLLACLLEEKNGVTL